VVSDTSDAESGRGTKSAGRRLGVTAFWVMAAYVIGASSLSIIPSLFFPAYGPRMQSPGLERCAREIEALDRDLLRAVTERLHAVAYTPGSLAAWDERFVALQDCGPLDDARRDLGKLRDGLEALLRRYEQGPRITRERIHRALTSSSEHAGARARPES
jgi:hypothetical protein